MHIDNKNKDILILGEGSTQGLNDTTLIAEAKYPVNFTESGKRFVLSLHYNGSNSFLYVNATKIYQFKIFQNILQLTIWKKQDLKGSVKFFSVDFNPIDTNDILDMHKYLLKKT